MSVDVSIWYLHTKEYPNREPWRSVLVFGQPCQLSYGSKAKIRGLRQKNEPCRFALDLSGCRSIYVYQHCNFLLLVLVIHLFPFSAKSGVARNFVFDPKLVVIEKKQCGLHRGFHRHRRHRGFHCHLRHQARRSKQICCFDHRSITPKFVTPTALSCIDNNWRSTTLIPSETYFSGLDLKLCPTVQDRWKCQKLKFGVF